jgi:pimeloyl-ACP methyl ester carboxylesterase
LTGEAAPDDQLAWHAAQPGRPLCVCVSGLGGTAKEWAEVGPALARAVDVVAVELALGPPARTPDHSRPLLAERGAISRGDGGPLQAAVSALDLVIGVAPDGAFLICHSMGALAGMLLAATGTSRLAGVVLTAPFLPAARNGRSTLATAVDYARHRALFLAGTRRRHRGRGPQTPAIGRQTRAAALGALARYGLRPTAFHAMADRLDCPVLLVHGGADHYVPPAFARAAAARHPAWQLALIPGAGHFPPPRQPDRLARRRRALDQPSPAARLTRARRLPQCQGVQPSIGERGIRVRPRTSGIRIASSSTKHHDQSSPGSIDRMIGWAVLAA